MIVKEIEDGLGRGYVKDESGTLSIVDIAVVDGKPFDTWGIPYNTTGKLVELKGWPDKMAVEVNSILMIAVS